jgi:hypothetical protein
MLEKFSLESYNKIVRKLNKAGGDRIDKERPDRDGINMSVNVSLNAVDNKLINNNNFGKEVSKDNMN